MRVLLDVSRLMCSFMYRCFEVSLLHVEELAIETTRGNDCVLPSVRHYTYV